MLPVLLSSLVIFAFILIKSADITVIALKHLSERLHAKAFTLSAILLAVGTSFPEISVGIASALEGSPNLALGVAVGSNIANIALVVGISALSAGGFFVKGEYLKRDLWISLVTGLAPLVFLSDGAISQGDGLVLLAIYVVYTTGFFRVRLLDIARNYKEDVVVHRFIRQIKITGKSSSKHLIRLIIGISLLLFSADMIVRVSKELSVALNIPVLVVGLVILAIGTSLPELAFSLRSLRDHESGMFVGNILGSTVANSTLIVGLASVIAPIEVVAVNEYLVVVIVFILVSLLFWYFSHARSRIDWWEALLLLFVYAIFVILEFNRGRIAL